MTGDAVSQPARGTTLDRLPTPALVIDRDAFDHNVATMGARWPGTALRPHVKAFKSTALARALADAGHTAFCAATPRELAGMAAAGLGQDLLLANETVDPHRLAHLGALVADGSARITVAVDSPATIDAAVRAGLREALVDVNVGLPRCGCDPADAGRLAEAARAAGLHVRGVMGYEGHVVGLADRARRDAGVAACMQILMAAHAEVGGEVVSGGGTGTWDSNTWVTEMQAGSFTLMDTAYAHLDLPFRQALFVLGTVISVNAKDGFAVADVGLKSLGMDHGDPTIDGAQVWFCSDEHVTFGAAPGADFASLGLHVGDRVRVWPAHIDPTVALHERAYTVRTSDGAVADDAAIEDVWPIDLRNW